MYIVTALNGVKYLKSDCLLSKHGYSTRVGGVSSTSHTAALNLAFGRGDDRETVIRNLELFAEAVGVESKNIVSVPQIHSDKIMLLTKSDCGLGYYREPDVSLDGYLTKEKGVTPGVRTADCVPILLEARRNGKVLAVGAAHAGWRGTVQKIAEKALVALCELSGCNPYEIYAAIGPSIGQCCFETDINVKNDITKYLGSQISDKFIIIDSDENKYYPNLALINQQLLHNVGVPTANIDVCELCTYCHPELFYSHRYTKGLRGTMLSLICC